MQTVSIGPASGGSGTGQLNISLTETGSDIPVQLSHTLNSCLNSFSPRFFETITLANGDNAITVPTGASSFAIEMPSTNTNATSVRWTGATGQPIAPNGTAGASWDQNHLPTTLTINSTGGCAGVKVWMF